MKGKRPEVCSFMLFFRNRDEQDKVSYKRGERFIVIYKKILSIS